MTTGRYMLRAFYVSLIEIGIKFILRQVVNQFMHPDCRGNLHACVVADDAVGSLVIYVNNMVRVNVMSFKIA